MKKLHGVSYAGGRSIKWWRHNDDYGNSRLTAETVQDVEPIINYVKARSDVGDTALGRYRGSVPHTVVEELARINSKIWGVRVGEAWKEIMSGKTDRGKSAMELVLTDRDYRKFQRQ